MDSDEEQLVIDEDLLVKTNPPTASSQVCAMEVADTSQDDSNEATSTQSETNTSEKSAEQTDKRKTKFSQQSPRHSKPSSSSHKSSRKESSHDRHKKSSHKHRYRSKEHRTHSDRDKKASSTSYETPNKDKKGSQTNWFKLTHLSKDYKSKELNISALKHQFYNMRLYVHRGKMLVCDMPEIYPAPPTMADISLKQLFNWPGVSFTIQLEHFSIVYEFKTNIKRDVVISDNNYINLRKDEENVMETRYIQNVASKKEQRTVSKDMLRCYLGAILQVAPLHDVPKSKLSETEAAFQKILELISTVNDDLIEMNSTHSQLMNKYKYVRMIDNHTDQSYSRKAKIREIINPEGTFRIDRCTLSMEETDVWLDAVETYFEEILITRRGQDAKSLKERIKKCLSMRCELCNIHFEGAMSTVSMKEHVKDKHFYDRPWECVFCNKYWTQFELTDMAWKHECKTIEDEEATITSSQN